MGMGLGAILAQQFRANTSASNKLEAEHMRHLISHLRSIVTGMAAGVDMHQGRIQMVNNTLNNIDADNPAVMEQAINALLEANKLMQDQLSDAQTRIAKQAQAIEKVTAQARTDAVTGVANRLAFNEAVDEAISSFKSEGRTTTLAMLDIDFFKKINDTYGHAVGDEVLKAVGDLLQEKLQGRGMVARYGGEEFAVLFAGCPAAWMVRIVEEARKSVEDHVVATDQGNIRVTCSAGMADICDGDTVATFIDRADQGLYISKQNGRNRGHWCSHGKWLPMEQRTLEMLWHPLDPATVIALDHQSSKKNSSPKPDFTPSSSTEQPDTRREMAVVEIANECVEIALKAAGPAEDSLSGDKPKPRRGNNDRPCLLQKVIEHDQFVDCLSQSLKSMPEMGEPVSVLHIRIVNRRELLKKFGEDAVALCVESLLQAIRYSLRGVDKIGRTANGDFEVLMEGPMIESVCYRAARIQLGLNSANETLALSEMRIQMAAISSLHADSPAVMLERIDAAFASDVDRIKPCILVHDGEQLRIEAHPLMVL